LVSSTKGFETSHGFKNGVAHYAIYSKKFTHRFLKKKRIACKILCNFAASKIIDFYT
jgi:hypothetical protein